MPFSSYPERSLRTRKKIKTNGHTPSAGWLEIFRFIVVGPQQKGLLFVLGFLVVPPKLSVKLSNLRTPCVALGQKTGIWMALRPLVGGS